MKSSRDNRFERISLSMSLTVCAYLMAAGCSYDRSVPAVLSFDENQTGVTPWVRVLGEADGIERYFAVFDQKVAVEIKNCDGFNGSRKIFGLGARDKKLQDFIDLDTLGTLDLLDNIVFDCKSKDWTPNYAYSGSRSLYLKVKARKKDGAESYVRIADKCATLQDMTGYDKLIESGKFEMREPPSEELAGRFTTYVGCGGKDPLMPDITPSGWMIETGLTVLPNEIDGSGKSYYVSQLSFGDAAIGIWRIDDFTVDKLYEAFDPAKAPYDTAPLKAARHRVQEMFEIEGDLNAGTADWKYSDAGIVKMMPRADSGLVGQPFVSLCFDKCTADSYRHFYFDKDMKPTPVKAENYQARLVYSSHPGSFGELLWEWVYAENPRSVMWFPNSAAAVLKAMGLQLLPMAPIAFNERVSKYGRETALPSSYLLPQLRRTAIWECVIKLPSFQSRDEFMRLVAANCDRLRAVKLKLLISGDLRTIDMKEGIEISKAAWPSMEQVAIEGEGKDLSKIIFYPKRRSYDLAPIFAFTIQDDIDLAVRNLSFELRIPQPTATPTPSATPTQPPSPAVPVTPYPVKVGLFDLQRGHLLLKEVTVKGDVEQKSEGSVAVSSPASAAFDALLSVASSLPTLNYVHLEGVTAAAKEPIYNSGVIMTRSSETRTVIESLGYGGSLTVADGMMLLMDTDVLVRRAGTGIILTNNAKFLMENSAIRAGQGKDGGVSGDFMAGIAMERSQAFILNSSKIAGFKFGVSSIGQSDSTLKSFRSYYCVTGGKIIDDPRESISHNLGDSAPDAASQCQ